MKLKLRPVRDHLVAKLVFNIQMRNRFQRKSHDQDDNVISQFHLPRCPQCNLQFHTVYEIEKVEGIDFSPLELARYFVKDLKKTIVFAIAVASDVKLDDAKIFLQKF